MQLIVQVLIALLWLAQVALAAERCPYALLSGHRVPPALEAAITGLPFGATIPDAVYSNYDSKMIGEAIVLWAKQREKSYLPTSSVVPLDFVQDTQIMLHFSTENFDSIRSSGYLNQHESLRSYGTFSPSVRRDAENEFTGLKMAESGSNGLKVRPKSSLLHISKEVSVGTYSHAVTPQYGDAAMVLKPEVKRRTLWIIGDSLGIGRRKLTSNGYERELTRLRGTAFRECISVGSCAYIEGLIYGAIDFSDVDHFLVYDRRIAARLTLPEKPIFLASVESRYGRYVRNYLDVIQTGSVAPEMVPSSHWARFASRWPKPEPAPVTVLAASGPESAIAPPTTSEISPATPIEKVALEEKAPYREPLVEKGHVKREFITDTSGKRVVVSTPLKDEADWAARMEDLPRVMTKLATLGVPHVSVIRAEKERLISEELAASEQFGTQALEKTETRPSLLVEVNRLVSKLIGQHAYVGGLRPRDLVYGEKGLRVLAADRVKTCEATEEGALREKYREQLRRHWERHLTSDEMTLLLRGI